MALSLTGTSVNYFLSDHRGSTNGLVDASGAITSQTAYDSFGNQTGSLTTRYGFTGRERDDLSGLMYYRARFYDPKLGRFISEDRFYYSKIFLTLVSIDPANDRLESLSYASPT